MAEEAASSEVQGPPADQNPNSVEATIDSALGGGAMESTCNNGNGAESSSVTTDGEREKTLEYADELMARGAKAGEERDFAEATDCFSRALEIRAEHFGELAPECVSAYYKYGRALLYKAQEEADPLGSMPKKDDAPQEDSKKDTSAKTSVDAESSAASVSNDAEQPGKEKCSDDVPDDNVEEKGEEGEDESDEELGDGDEDESDLDLAWKMLDVARAITEKQSGDTMEKVDILSALAEVALEREDVETSLSDYLKALSMLERLVEPDSRLIAELNFRICLCLEIGSRPEEAIPYCKKAISICKSRVERLKDEVKSFSEPAESPTASETGQSVQLSSITSVSSDSLAKKEAESETLNGLCGELEKKLEDLQQLVANPKSILSDIYEIMAAKASEKNAIAPTASTGGNTESATVSTAPADKNGASGVTHLGVVGRGVKRVVMSSTMQSSPSKKPAIDPSSNNGDGTS
ncbi:hypothetical protein ACS0TY_006165 [Phlomoides rotata]